MPCSTITACCPSGDGAGTKWKNISRNQQSNSSAKVQWMHLWYGSGPIWKSAGVCSAFIQKSIGAQQNEATRQQLEASGSCSGHFLKMLSSNQANLPTGYDKK